MRERRIVVTRGASGTGIDPVADARKRVRPLWVRCARLVAFGGVASIATLLLFDVAYRWQDGSDWLVLLWADAQGILLPGLIVHFFYDVKKTEGR
jgi:hypothetical protein